MEEWAKVVIYPLGLAAFALFLVYLAWRQQPDSGFRRVLMAMAVLALVAGLGLAFWQDRNSAEPTSGRVKVSREGEETSQPEAAGSIQQETHGGASPAVGNVTGDVEVNIGQPPSSASPGEKPTGRESKGAPRPESRSKKPDDKPSIRQTTHGAASPAVSDVEGDVSIIITGPEK